MTKIEYELKFVARSFPFSSMDKRLVTSKPSLKKNKGKKTKTVPPKHHHRQHNLQNRSR